MTGTSSTTIQTFSYPSGFTYSNTIILGTRVQTPYDSIVDTYYSNSYGVDVVFVREGIQVVNRTGNTRATDFVLYLSKWLEF